MEFAADVIFMETLIRGGIKPWNMEIFGHDSSRKILSFERIELDGPENLFHSPMMK